MPSAVRLAAARGCTADADEYLPLLTALLPIAPRHAFVSGTPIAEAMRECGYENVTQVPVCRFGRIFLTVAMGSEPQWRRGALEPAVNFTLEQATGAKSGKGYVRAPEPDWVEAMGGQSAMNAAAENLRKSTKPPLRVAIDTSYDQDSQRAIRSVAKQLAECIGVKRRAMKVTGSNPGESGEMEISPVDVDLTFASWKGTVAAHALDHFNAERWSEVSKDPRDVQDIFMNGKCDGSSSDADTDAVRRPRLCTCRRMPRRRLRTSSRIPCTSSAASSTSPRAGSRGASRARTRSAPPRGAYPSANTCRT